MLTPASHGVTDSDGAVAMRRHRITPLARVRDDLRQGVAVELCVARRGAFRHGAAGGHHFDQVDTVFVLTGNDGGSIDGAGRFAAPEVTMALRRRHRLAGTYEPRSYRFAARDPIAQLEFEPFAATEVARRRDAGAHHLDGASRHRVELRASVAARLGKRIAQVRIEHHVHVRVDQAG